MRSRGLKLPRFATTRCRIPPSPFRRIECLLREIDRIVPRTVYPRRWQNLLRGTFLEGIYHTQTVELVCRRIRCGSVTDSRY